MTCDATRNTGRPSPSAPTRGRSRVASERARTPAFRARASAKTSGLVFATVRDERDRRQRPLERSAQAAARRSLRGPRGLLARRFLEAVPPRRPGVCRGARSANRRVPVRPLLRNRAPHRAERARARAGPRALAGGALLEKHALAVLEERGHARPRSEEQTSELQSPSEL